MLVRRVCLGGSLLLLCAAGCDRDQPLEPSMRASTAGGAVAQPPSNTTVSVASPTQLDVKWQDNSTNEGGFEVYDSATALHAFQLWTTTGPNDTARSFSVNPRQEYCVKVRAFTTLGRSGKVRAYSDFSNTACATTPPVAGPATVAARPAGSTAAQVTWSPWTDFSITIVGFRVERSIDHGGTWTKVTDTDQYTTRAVDYGRTPESPELCYRVIVRTWLFGESTPSKMVCTIPPAKPANLVAAGIDGPAVALSWKDSSTVEDGYVVLRAPDGVTFSAVADLAANSTSYRDAAVSGDARYWYVVRAKRDSGFSDASNTATAIAATAPPAAPAGLDAWPSGSTVVSLRWTDQSANEDGFRVERSTNGGAWDSADTTGVSEAWFTDVDRASEQQVSYRVIAFNGRGESAPSDPDSVTPPAAPTDLRATTAEGLAIDLRWADNSNVEDGYEVQQVVTYCDYDYCYSDYIPIATLDSNATSYHVAGLNPSEFDTYVVFALNDGGRSDPSNEDGAWSTVAPAAPTNLTATAVSASEIALTWTDNASNEQYFAIQRCLGDGAACVDLEFNIIDIIAWADANATTFSDVLDVQPSTAYTYRVRAYNGQYSAPSNAATVTTPP